MYYHLNIYIDYKFIDLYIFIFIYIYTKKPTEGIVTSFKFCIVHYISFACFILFIT